MEEALSVLWASYVSRNHNNSVAIRKGGSEALTMGEDGSMMRGTAAAFLPGFRFFRLVVRSPLLGPPPPEEVDRAA